MWQLLTIDTQSNQGASSPAPLTGSLKGYNIIKKESGSRDSAQTSRPRQVQSEASQGASRPNVSPVSATGSSSTHPLPYLGASPMDIHHSGDRQEGVLYL